MTELLTDEQLGIRRRREDQFKSDEEMGVTPDISSGTGIISRITGHVPAPAGQSDSFVPIPDPILPDQQTPPHGFQRGEQRTVDRVGVTSFLEAGSAVTGGAVGTPGGPITMIAGGALGAAAGRGLANLARDLEDQLRFGTPPQRTMAEQSLDMIKAGTTDLAFGAGIHGIGRTISQTLRFAGKFSGAHSPEVAEVIKSAARGGIGIGAIDLDKPFYSIASRVGGVMPIVGGPIRKAAAVKGAQISSEFVSVLDDVSPAIDLPRLGVKMTEAAKGTLSARRAIANARYADMHRVLGALVDESGSPAFVPSAPIKARVADLLSDLDQLPRQQLTRQESTGLVDFRGGEITREVVEKGARIGVPPADEGFIAVLRRFQDLPDQVSPAELEALQKNLNRAARARSGNAMSANEYRIITDINAATWDALDAIPKETLPPGARKELMSSILSAKRSWGDLKALEETAAAGKFKSVDKNFFKAGFSKPGSVEVDELANLYMSSQSSLRSPKFIDNLESLIGPENRKALARSILHRAAAPETGTALIKKAVQPERMFLPKANAGTGAMDIVVFDAARMRGNLGLSDPAGLLGEGAARQSRDALARLLRGTGVTVGRLDSFLRTAERIQASPTGDPSTFLTRRLILSGNPKALIPGSRAAGGAVEGGLSMMSLGLFTMTGRAFSRLISTPRGLQILREGLKPNLTRQHTLNLMQRVLRAFPGQDVALEEDQ